MKRHADHAINPIFIKRWSPRALSGESITDTELMSLFEAARWAPSSYNAQSWRFIYAKRDTKQWDILFNLMAQANQAWAKNAAVLIVVASRNNFEFNEKPSRTHTFDTGAAWQNLALQASDMGLVAHGMEGFDYEKARTALHIPDDYTVEAMIAIGRLGRKEDLSPEMQKAEEPSDRKKVEEFAFEGTFEQK
jgi:nitroreductase